MLLADVLDNASTLKIQREFCTNFLWVFLVVSVEPTQLQNQGGEVQEIMRSIKTVSIAGITGVGTPTWRGLEHAKKLWSTLHVGDKS